MIKRRVGLLVHYWPSLRKYVLGFIIGSWVTMLVPQMPSFDFTTTNKSEFSDKINVIYDSQNDKPVAIQSDGTNDWIQDTSVGVVNGENVYEIPKEVILDELGVIVVSADNQALVDLASKPVEPKKGSAYIEISSDLNPVYWFMDPSLDKAMWYYEITFKETNGVGFEIDEIIETFIHVNTEPAIIKHKKSDLLGWFGSTHIKPNTKVSVKGGMNSQLVSYLIWTIRGTDDNGNYFENNLVLPLSQIQLIKEGNEDVVIEDNEAYDTLNLKNEAAFEIEVADGVYWVPANHLGKSMYSNKKIEEMLILSPEEKQAKITNLYEALQLYQIGNFLAQDGSNKQEMIDSIYWEYHIPGKEAVSINAGDCSTSSSWLTYILKDDYDEVGYIAYSQSTGNGHVFNYIKQEGYYYFIDMTHYRVDFDYRGYETGFMIDYYNSDFIAGNIHKVKDIQAYITYIMDEYNDPPELLFMYHTGEVADIGVKSSETMNTIYYPTNRNVVNVYDDPNDKIDFQFLAKSAYQGSWSTIQKNPIKSNLPFN